MTHVRRFAALLVAAMSVGCASASVSIRHEDASVARAAVEIDGKPRGTVSYGGEREFDVEEGRHRIRLTADGTQVSPWSDKRGWVVIVEDELSIVLHDERDGQATDSAQRRSRSAQSADEERAAAGRTGR